MCPKFPMLDPPLTVITYGAVKVIAFSKQRFAITAIIYTQLLSTIADEYLCKHLVHFIA